MSKSSILLVGSGRTGVMWMRNVFMAMVLGGLCMFNTSTVEAAYPKLTYRHGHHLFEVNPNYYSILSPREIWTLNGKEVVPLAEWRVDGDAVPALPTGVARTNIQDWDREAIAEMIRQRVASRFDRDAGSVQISRTLTGAIVFDGLGMLGREVQMDQAVALTIRALEEEVSDIVIPIRETQPEITVLDPGLRNSGIQEVVTVGESNFAGSPYNRRHNIATGLEKFNGHIIPQDSLFSFNDILGPVNGSTGYLKELVIQGDKTIPEYGGGLCQISTTAYRGAWEHGFPIEKRRNHSFAVGYYGPQGTDATIYPPHTDMKFTNDGPSDLLIQTYVEGDDAYFIYYGTRDDRISEVLGPYTWDHRPAPANRTEYTTSLPEGMQKKVGSAVPGLKAAWYRVLGEVASADCQEADQDGQTDQEEQNGPCGPVVEEYYSAYQARPLYYQIGIAEGAPIPGEDSDESTEATVETEQPETQPERSGWSRRNVGNRPTRRSIRRGVAY